MPILAGAGTPPPAPSPPSGGTPIVIPQIGHATATYYDPTGAGWPLTTRSTGWYTLSDGIAGLGAAPVELTTDDYPRGGSRLRHAQPLSRSIIWPLRVEADTHQEFTARWRALARAITRTSRDGPGILEIARPDGTRRQIPVYYEAGFEGLGRGTAGLFWDIAVLQWYCEDPYFLDPVPQVVHRELAAGADYLDPYPSVSSSQVLGVTSVTNPGDVPVWPRWTITGPASLVTMTRGSQSFVLDPNAAAIGHGNLLAGEQVTVTTDPPMVRYQDGTNWIASLNWPSATLWPLDPGDNAVTFQLDGAGAGSAVDLSFYPRYETA